VNLHKKVLLIAMLGLTLSACNKLGSKHVKCADPTVEPLLKQEVQTQLEKSLDVNLKELIRNGSIKDLDPAKLKVMAKNLHYRFEDVRTDFIDPDSSKTTCVISFEATIPADVLKKADDARSKFDKESTAAYAFSKSIDLRDTNKVDLNLEYVLHPTDDGKKVFISLKNFAEVEKLLSETLTYAFVKPQIEKNQIANPATYIAPIDATSTVEADDYYGE